MIARRSPRVELNTLSTPNNSIPIVFWGGSGQAKVLRELLNADRYRLIAIFDNNRTVPAPFADVPMFYGEDQFKAWCHSPEAREKTACLSTIGGADGGSRLERQEFMSSFGLRPIIAVHVAAHVATNAAIAAGSQVLANATIAAEAILGRACIVNTSASVDHECILGDGVHIGPGATLAGCVVVGECSFVGTGAVVLPRIKIGKHSVIGAGSVVTRDVPENVVVYGNPARIVRTRH